MNEHNPRKARWSILLFAATLIVGSLGLSGCPDDDDDDDIFDKRVPVARVAQGLDANTSTS